MRSACYPVSSNGLQSLEFYKGPARRPAGLTGTRENYRKDSDWISM
jgi:hypothetical protein